MKRFLISCGGTGGHLSPGIAVAEGLRERGHQATLLISHKKVDSRLIEKYPGLEFVRIPGVPFSWNPVQFARCLVSQVSGFFFCLRLVRDRKPDGVVGFGGFTSAGIVLAARAAGVPLALHEANRVPGRAIRFLGRFATRVYFPPGIRLRSIRAAATRHLGLPVRREIARISREEACAVLGLDPGRCVLAVLGGSQGATSLNDWARGAMQALASEGIQLYCVTGLGKGLPAVGSAKAGVREQHDLPAKDGTSVRSIFVPFCDRMAELLSGSDLVVSRAGAGTLAELIRCATPAILVPFPFAADNHQRANAAFFERQGGGLVVDQAGLPNLKAEVCDAIFNEWLLRQFRSNLQRMDRANSLELLLRDLEEITAETGVVAGGTAVSTP